MEDQVCSKQLARSIVEDVDSVRSALYNGECSVGQPIPDVLDILDRGEGETVVIQRSTLMDIAERVTFLSGEISVALRYLDTIEHKSITIANS